MCYESEMQLIRASYLRKQKVTSTALHLVLPGGVTPMRLPEVAAAKLVAHAIACRYVSNFQAPILSPNLSARGAGGRTLLWGTVVGFGWARVYWQRG